MLTNLADIDLRNLRVFKAVVESNGFSAAQAKLNISASTISTSIKDLEIRLGMSLCQRGRVGFKLTEKGDAIYRSTVRLFEAIEGFTQEASGITDILSGDLRVGLTDFCLGNPNYKFIDAIEKFNRRENSARISLKYLSVSELESQILDGQLHLAIGFFPQHIKSINYDALFTEENNLYCGSSHPFFNREGSELTKDDIKNTPYVSKGIMESHQSLAPPYDMNLRAISENVEGLAMLVLSGNYIASFPKHYADIWVSKGKMKAVNEKLFGRTVEFHLITRRGTGLPLVAKAFMDDLKAVYKKA